MHLNTCISRFMSCCLLVPISALGSIGCDKTEPVQAGGSTQGSNKAPPSGTSSPGLSGRATTGSSAQPSSSDGRVQMGDQASTVKPSTAPAAASAGTAAKPTTPSPNSEPPKSAGDGGNPTVASFAGLAAPKPATWQWRAPSTNMRAAEYTVPGVEDAGQAQIVVYQFAGGGTPESNINRWKTQVRQADGSPTEAKVQEIESDGMTVTVAELTGEYKGMGQTEFRPDQILIAAMVETDGNPVFIQLSGPSKTVSSNREAFMTLLRGLKKSEPMK